MIVILGILLKCVDHLIYRFLIASAENVLKMCSDGQVVYIKSHSDMVNTFLILDLLSLSLLCNNKKHVRI